MLSFPLTILLLFLTGNSALKQQQTSSTWPAYFTIAQGQVAATCLQAFAEDLLARSSSDRIPESLAANRTLNRIVQNPQSQLSACRANHICSGCLNATLLDPRVPSCERACKDSPHCELACKQLRGLVMNRPGDCPTVRDPRMCTTSCSSDLDCLQTDGLKCCNTGICRTCKRLVPTPEPNPPLPSSPIATVVKDSAQRRHLTWQSVSNNVSNQLLLNPIVYAVQARYMVGPKFDPALMGDWLPLHVVTSDLSLRIDEWRAGHFYQFRVAAIGARGSRGFGPPSEPTAQSRSPNPPNQPSNLSEGRMRMYSNGRVSVRIYWAPPKPSDLPIVQYQVSWTKDHGFVNSDGARVLSMTKFSKKLPANARTDVIENLEPATSYKIEVSAISKWGDEYLEGQSNSIFVSTLRTLLAAGQTQPKPKQQNQQQILQQPEQKHSQSISASCLQRRGDRSSLSVPSLVLIRAATFEQGSLNIQLKILDEVDSRRAFDVRWQSRVCIDKQEGSGSMGRGVASFFNLQQGQEFVIDKLQFNCRYSIVLTPFQTNQLAMVTGGSYAENFEDRIVHDRQNILGSNPELGIGQEACFSTPSCSEVAVARGSKPPACKNAQDNSAPGEPRNIRVERLLRNQSPTKMSSHLTYRVTWQPPEDLSNAPGHSSAYRIMWGPRKDEPISQDAYSSSGLLPQIDLEKAVNRVLKENTSLIIEPLSPSTLYVIKLRVHAYYHGQLRAVGPEVTYFFTTDNPGKSSSSAFASQSAGGASLHYNQNSDEVRRFVRVNYNSNSAAREETIRDSRLTCLLATIVAILPLQILSL